MTKDWLFDNVPCPACGHHCADSALCAEDPGCMCDDQCHITGAVPDPADRAPEATP
ncbi:MAG TPA: hypothetical protein VGW74_06960 [Propionibacteriaceae bacterium]|nr:hypothetical protein [Propionibacteriaceae bacterium]